MFFVFLRITPNNKVQKSSYLARSRPHVLENLPRFPDIPAAADVTVPSTLLRVGLADPGIPRGPP